MKAALVTLSGLRIRDQSLMDLGFSFPAVRNRANQIESLPSLGLLTVAACLPDTWHLTYIESREIGPRFSWEQFDVVFFSFLSATSAEAFSLSRSVRDVGIKTVAGGLHVTLVPDECRPHFDILVCGEAEACLPDLVSDLENNNTRFVYDARPRGPFDLNKAPMPRFDLLDPEKYSRVSIQTQRGCPWSCSFCASSIRLAPGFRAKPVPHVINEIRAVKKIFRQPFIELADDNTFADKRHARELVEAIAGEGIEWFTETDISLSDDEGLLERLAESGCRQVLIGLESPTANDLAGIEMVANWKARKSQSYMKAIEKIQSYGVSVNGCFVLGLDGQGPECFEATFDFVEKSGLYDVQITFLTPFPGTPAYKKLSDEGRILIEPAGPLCTLFDINFKPDHMSVHELREGFYKLAARLYAPENIRKRNRHFVRTSRSRRNTTDNGKSHGHKN